MADALLTPKEYAALFRKHLQTVYRSIRSGRIAHQVERTTSPSRVLIRVPRSLVDHVRQPDEQ